MIKYCPTCNRSSDTVRFVGEICEICRAAKLKKAFPFLVKLSYCKRCERIKSPDGYTAMRRESLAASISKELCGSRCKVRVLNFDGKEAELRVTVEVEGEPVSFEKKVEVRLEHQICETCYRKSSGYYEAIVQIRGDKKKAGALVEKIGKYIAKGSAFIGKIDEVDGGMDVYVSDKKIMAEYFMSRRMKTHASYTLYGIKNGKKVYRNTYLVRLDEN